MANRKDDNSASRKNNEEAKAGHNIQQPRQPQNVDDLLRYAIEAESQDTSGIPTPDVGPLDPERREFLEEAVSSMTVDVTNEMLDAVTTLQLEYNEGDATDEFVRALDIVSDYTINIDAANDFFKLGGFDACKTWLEKDGPPEVRWRASGVIGECCQNNLFCQTKAIETGLLKILMDLSLKDSDEMVKSKSFHAVSCIVRNNENTLMNFLSLNGHKLILNCLKSPSNKLKTKAAFFTSVIARKEGMLQEQLWDIGVVAELVSLVSSSSETKLIEDVSCLEQCLSALLCLLTKAPKKLTDLQSVVANLFILKDKLGNDPAYIESVDYITQIVLTIDPKAVP